MWLCQSLLVVVAVVVLVLAVLVSKSMNQLCKHVSVPAETGWLMTEARQLHAVTSIAVVPHGVIVRSVQ